jgi:exopolyphosphatase/guanosine-5'-triphosphate,3'-diphosphate pyrophosphatase
MVIGSSGTVRALAKILRKSNRLPWIEKGKLKKLIQMMSQMSTNELLNLPGIESKRVDMILAGAILLEECMCVLGSKMVRATEYSLRDGILEEEKQWVSRKKKAHPSFHLHVQAVYHQALCFGKTKAYLKCTEKTARVLFQKLQEAHRLGPQWCIYLVAAAMLRDVGEVVSMAQHSEQSYYLIKHCALPLMEEWEIDLIANLSLYHHGVKFEVEEIPFRNAHVRKAVFMKLLALLRILDALDTYHSSPVRPTAVSLSKTSICLEIPRSQWTGLENLDLESKRRFFKMAMGRSIQVAADV